MASIVSTILSGSLYIVVGSTLVGPRSRGCWGQSKKSASRSWALVGGASPLLFTRQRIQYRRMWTSFSSNGHGLGRLLKRRIMGVPLNMLPWDWQGIETRNTRRWTDCAARLSVESSWNFNGPHLELSSFLMASIWRMPCSSQSEFFQLRYGHGRRLPQKIFCSSNEPRVLPWPILPLLQCSFKSACKGLKEDRFYNSLRQ